MPQIQTKPINFFRLSNLIPRVHVFQVMRVQITKVERFSIKRWIMKSGLEQIIKLLQKLMTLFVFQ